MSTMTIPSALYQKLLEAERNLTDMTAQLPIAEKCGVDCQAYKQKLAVQLELISQIKASMKPV